MGGHNYYNNRDMTRAVHRFNRMGLEKGIDGWRERYEKWLEEKRDANGGDDGKNVEGESSLKVANEDGRVT